ncbi:Heat shock factor binding protein 1 [Musa troglodytarum]|uniref:Heat shock factor binding protein 1 n=1 Tax=Musa troglodytarum TaxID=320322 RepID=A0A9E7FDK4_9LILI|nr:Heat shock factor binding protein 1 [Musa troglodytarum]
MAATNPGCVKHPDQDSESSMQSTADMTAFVQNLLVQMKTRFQAMSEGIVSKNILCQASLASCPNMNVLLNCNSLDEMGSKIDKLEQSIKDLNAEMEGASKSKPEDDKPSDEPV